MAKIIHNFHRQNITTNLYFDFAMDCYLRLKLIFRKFYFSLKVNVNFCYEPKTLKYFCWYALKERNSAKMLSRLVLQSPIHLMTFIKWFWISKPSQCAIAFIFSFEYWNHIELLHIAKTIITTWVSCLHKNIVSFNSKAFFVAS